MSTPSIDPDLARIIVESATDFAIVTTDPGGHITSWNPGAEKLLGWLAEEAIGRSADMFFTPEDRAADVPAGEMTRALTEGRAVDERFHLRRDGSRFWGSGLMMPLTGGDDREARGFVKMMRDRTQDREADRRYHALSAALPALVFVTDSDGANIETNGLFQEYTGRSVAELNGDRWLEALHEGDRARAAEIWGEAVAGGVAYEARYRFRRHDGEYRCFACRGVPVHDDDGKVLRWMGTCIDVEDDARARAAIERLNLNLEHRVTEQEADLATAIENLERELSQRLDAEAALRQAQKMEAVGQLTGGVAHDFNNLLTIIRASVDLLLRRDLPEDKRRRYIEAIGDTADRAAALTRQLLAFARKTPLKPEVFDVSSRTEAIGPMLRTTTGSRMIIEVDRPDAPALVEADPNQFETALLNLVVNARDAMAGEGELRISIRAADEVPARRGHAAQSGDYVSVAVTDTGTGMPPDTLARVFEPFFTTKEVGRGTGLGLSQVIGFAKQSGGDVTADSEEGRGATFTLYLPRAVEGAVTTSPVLPEPPVEATGRGCVLVVEDNETVGEFAAQLLDELGCSSVWANGAKAALELIAEKPDRFDMVFSDVVMPGMSGIELAERIRRQAPQLPVVLTSGYSHVLAQEGTHGFELLQKPYSVDALSRLLNRVLGDRP